MTVQKTININGSLIDLSTPKVMGIINVTPDSFYSGSRKTDIHDILKTAEQIQNEGATFVDIGGYSSRPGADDISVADEIARVEQPIQQICKEFPDLIISIDTFRSEVAKAALNVGAHIINDISAGDQDPNMIKLAGEAGVPFIAMHMKGTPQTMKDQTNYDDLLKEITLYLVKKIKALRDSGVKDVIIDPGFGFAKNIEQNFQLLKHLEFLKHTDVPILVGVSRKSMIYKSLNIEPDGALNGTTVLNTVALLKGASILRVHDVKEAVEAVKLTNYLKN